MPTLAQVLQEKPDIPSQGRVVTIVSSTLSVIETSYGDIVNATGHAPAAGQMAIVLTIEGRQYAIGHFTP